jgi:hypothetical protein
MTVCGVATEMGPPRLNATVDVKQWCASHEFRQKAYDMYRASHPENDFSIVDSAWAAIKLPSMVTLPVD